MILICQLNREREGRRERERPFFQKKNVSLLPCYPQLLCYIFFFLKKKTYERRSIIVYLEIMITSV